MHVWNSILITLSALTQLWRSGCGGLQATYQQHRDDAQGSHEQGSLLTLLLSQFPRKHQQEEKRRCCGIQYVFWVLLWMKSIFSQDIKYIIKGLDDNGTLNDTYKIHGEVTTLVFLLIKMRRFVAKLAYLPISGWRWRFGFRFWGFPMRRNEAATGGRECRRLAHRLAA